MSSAIYHIEVGPYIYIGQTKQLTKPKDTGGDTIAGNRVLQHFSGTYNSAEPKFRELIQKYPLSKFKITIYREPNYGIPEDVYNDFSSMWYVQGDGKSNKLDIAEILHIYYYQRRPDKTVINQEFGGQAWQWTTQTGAILDKTSTVDSAVSVLDMNSKIAGEIQKRCKHQIQLVLEKGQSEVIEKGLMKLVDIYLTNPTAKVDSKLRKTYKVYILSILKKIIPAWKSNINEITVDGTTVKLSVKTKKEWARIHAATWLNERRFQNLANNESFNVLDQLAIRLNKTFEKNISINKTASLTEELKTALKEQIKKAIVDTKNQLNKSIQSVLNVSWSQFIDVTIKNANGVEVGTTFLKNLTIADGSIETDIYQPSLKRMSYFFFRNIAFDLEPEVDRKNQKEDKSKNKETKKPEEIISKNIRTTQNDETIINVGFSPSWTQLIKRKLRTKGEIFQDEEWLDKYVHQMLTILVNLNHSAVPFYGKKPVWGSSAANGLKYPHYGQVEIQKGVYERWPITQSSFRIIETYYNAHVNDIKIY